MYNSTKVMPTLHYDFDGRGEILKASIRDDGKIEKVYKDKIYIYDPKTGEEMSKDVEVNNNKNNIE